MVKRNSTRRKARTPKFIEVEGHRLTEAMHEDYQRCLQAVAGRFSNQADDARQMLKLGLANFLSGYRPSHKIAGQLVDSTKQVMTASLAIASMSDYTWESADPDSIRAAGCDVVKKLALELYNASAKLTAIAMNVEAEKTTKLQDWLARDQEIERIGRGAEVTHG